MLQLSQTRWLSLDDVVKRILEQYDAQMLHFTNAHLNDKVLEAETILNRLRDISTKLYFQYLNFVLPFFNNLNLEMQSKNIRIHSLHKKIEYTFRALVDCYRKRE